MLAKQLVTLDVLSAGRLQLVTVGLGTVAREAAAVDVDFRTRGARANEAIDVLRLLWADGAEGVAYSGQVFSFDDICVLPKPVQGAELPIHVGGSSLAAVRRAGTRGDGYFAGGMVTPQQRLDQFDAMRQAAIDTGRDPSRLQYTRCGSLDLDAGRVGAYADHGIDRLVVNPLSFRSTSSLPNSPTSPGESP